MACEPAVNDFVSRAVPAESSATTPRTVEPSLKVMLPVGVPEESEGVTVAVNVTAWPAVAGLRLDASAVPVDGVAEHLDQADLAAALGFVLDADHPGGEHRPRGDPRSALHLDVSVAGRVAEHGGLGLAHQEAVAEGLLPPWAPGRA